MAHKIIGTAGHIDHGKSSLIKVLTGTDPDRLAEEQERGMTIDLGFAFLNNEIAFIDVPGHEKFIKNMVAGASTVDAVLLVIAADDGVMPQTREHLDILKLLQVKHGLVALTKIDMVEEEWLDIVEEDIRELLQTSFLKNADIQRVSSTTGAGIYELRTALEKLLEQTPSRQDRGIFWMPVDRSFSIKGHGTVVTGSVLSGDIRLQDAIELLPSKKMLRLRGIQTHGASSEHAGLGERTALNLMNIAKDEIQRGDVIATAGYFEPSMLFDAKLSLLADAPKALKNRTRVRLHLGTREVMARLKLLGCEKIDPGGEGFVQIMTEEIAVAQKRDPFVIRQYSPQVTIGGGIILDTNPKAHRRTDKNTVEKLANLERFDPAEVIAATILHNNAHPMKLADISKTTGIDSDQTATILNELVNNRLLVQIGSKPTFVHRQVYDKLCDTILSAVSQFHQKNPLRPGMARANLLNQTGIKAPQLFETLLRDLQERALIVESNTVIKTPDHEIKLTPQDEKLARQILEILTMAEFSPPPAKILAEQTGHTEEQIQKIIGALLGMEKLVRLEGDLYFVKTAIGSAKEKLMNFAKTKEEITVAEFREMLTTSRKFAVPLLGYFDEHGITIRVGDVRQIVSQGK